MPPEVLRPNPGNLPFTPELNKGATLTPVAQLMAENKPKKLNKAQVKLPNNTPLAPTNEQAPSEKIKTQIKEDKALALKLALEEHRNSLNTKTLTPQTLEKTLQEIPLALKLQNKILQEANDAKLAQKLQETEWNAQRAGEQPNDIDTTRQVMEQSKEPQAETGIQKMRKWFETEEPNPFEAPQTKSETQEKSYIEQLLEINPKTQEARYIEFLQEADTETQESYKEMLLKADTEMQEKKTKDWLTENIYKLPDKAEINERNGILPVEPYKRDHTQEKPHSIYTIEETVDEEKLPVLPFRRKDEDEESKKPNPSQAPLTKAKEQNLFTIAHQILKMNEKNDDNKPFLDTTVPQPPDDEEHTLFTFKPTPIAIKA